jgi:hypothetical protein
MDDRCSCRETGEGIIVGRSRRSGIEHHRGVTWRRIRKIVPAHDQGNGGERLGIKEGESVQMGTGIRRGTHVLRFRPPPAADQNSEPPKGSLTFNQWYVVALVSAEDRRVVPYWPDTSRGAIKLTSKVAAPYSPIADPKPAGLGWKS